LTAAVIVAAGRSERMGANKMLLEIGGKPVLWHTFCTFERCAAIDEMVLVASEETEELCRRLAGKTDKPCHVVLGGERRQDSVKNGLAVIPHADIVAIQDGARPFTTERMIVDSIESAKQYGSGVVAIPMSDTVKRAEGGIIKETIDRRQLIRMQTPQTFDYKLICMAYERMGTDVTDDASLLEAMGMEVYTVMGSENNIKLTNAEDVKRAEAILGVCPVRIGMGEDHHLLVEGRKLILGGVEIPYEKGLLGHSDADVLVHAVTDALLGAAALGDIGQHFPDSDPAYKGADSLVLLARAAALLREKGYEIVNTDATVTAQRPKLMPHIPVMREKLAAAMGVAASAVSVKATTSEGMDAVGRGEGMTARAIAMIKSV